MGKVLTKFATLVLPWGLLLGLLFFLFFRPQQRWASHREILLTRLESLQRLEVLQAHLLAHNTVQAQDGLLKHSEFLLVAQGRAIYGLDLSQLTITQGSEGQLQVNVPGIQVLEMVLDPRSIEYLGLKKGLLTSQREFEDLKQGALKNLQADLARQARQEDLYQEAEKAARKYLQTLVAGLGVDRAEIVFARSHLQKISPPDAAAAP